ncbi:hypothetical protein BHE74_00045735 [Ensete ventricosum]|nr:hypothetical protein GW17_00021938 [Ensete ventricosum]RWW48211.1 hypothetical protein BHE74_00045735 [Ensete ventricosum]
MQGIRIIQAAAGAGQTMLISDAGQVYAFGKESFGEAEHTLEGSKVVTTPQLVKSLKDIYVVQAAIGNFFSAVLSREGRVYTFCWGNDSKLGHRTEPNDLEPHPLLGPLENVPVVQIAAGYCYLLALACQPSGMSVYSVGCGLGGKLGHGSMNDEKYPRLIEQFQTLNLQPRVVAAGAWHAAVVGQDGRACTWGWGRYGCLGHGNEESESVPKVVESLSSIKAVHVATGDYTTFVVSDTGDVYSFGYGESSSLGHSSIIDGQVYSGKLYAFGAGDKGQLGTELPAQQTERAMPEQVDINLNVDIVNAYRQCLHDEEWEAAVVPSHILPCLVGRLPLAVPPHYSSSRLVEVKKMMAVQTTTRFKQRQWVERRGRILTDDDVAVGALEHLVHNHGAKRGAEDPGDGLPSGDVGPLSSCRKWSAT